MQTRQSTRNAAKEDLLRPDSRGSNNSNSSNAENYASTPKLGKDSPMLTRGRRFKGALDGIGSLVEFSSPSPTFPLSQKRIRRNLVVTPKDSEKSLEQLSNVKPPLKSPLTATVDISIVNDSFLNDLDQLEANANNANYNQNQNTTPIPMEVQISKEVELNNASKSILPPQQNLAIEGDALDLLPRSPDMFGDFDDFGDFDIPASQFQIDPTVLPPHELFLNRSRPGSSKKRKKPIEPSTAAHPPVPLTSRNINYLVDGNESEPPAKRPSSRKKKESSGSESKKNKNKSKGTSGTNSKKKQAQFKLAYTNRKAGKLLSNSGNNELSKEDLSCMSEEEKLQLASWGLPKSILLKYKSKGVTSLFPWQLECLANEGVLEGRNLLYSAPTSAGKTLVAEILMVKRVLELGKKAIMILPYVSVCREKMFSMQDILGDAGIRVEGFMGSYAPPGGFKSVDIAICTIEKANSLINRLLEEDSLSQLGTVVVDELHLIGDHSRGTLLELILTKIKYMISKTERVSDDSMLTENTETKKTQIQVIGMSATLPNLSVLSKWMDAQLVITDYRPVPLTERIIINGKMFDQKLQPIRDVRADAGPVGISNDLDHTIYLSLETVLGGHSILIFCPSKAKCENLAKRIAQEFFKIGNLSNIINPEIGGKLREQLDGTKLMEVLSQLKECPGGLDEVLKSSVSYGVAFHHAGLTFDERDIIESAFKKCIIRVIVATSTLSAGVNLPARRVIISTPKFMPDVLDPLTYRQMCGRAGRKGVDTEGESILICTTENKDIGIRLVQSSLPNVQSALLGKEGALTSSMKRALLEVIASGIATYPKDVDKYAKCTLLSNSIDLGIFSQEELTSSQCQKDQTIQNCLNFLEENEFIRLQKYESEDKDDEYMATQLGKACLASSMAPDEGILVYKELLNARKCFVLDTDLHIVYQVTPISLAQADQLERNFNWSEYLNIWDKLSSEDKVVGKMVGIDEAFIVRAATGAINPENGTLKSRSLTHKRFFIALALNDLVNEMSMGDVTNKYYLDKGMLQNLQNLASSYAGMVTSFCGKLGWSNLELLLSQFQERLQFGVQRELCDLVRLSTMNGQRARILYDNGIKTVAELAASDPILVENILHRAGPFQSVVHAGSSENPQRVIWVIGKNGGLNESEAARSIVHEARQFIQVELGLPENIQYDVIPIARNEESTSFYVPAAAASHNNEDIKQKSFKDKNTFSSESSDLEDFDPNNEIQIKLETVEERNDSSLSQSQNSLNLNDNNLENSRGSIVLISSPIVDNNKKVIPPVKDKVDSYKKGDSVFEDSFPTCSQDMFADIPQVEQDENDEADDEKMDISVEAFVEEIVHQLRETSMDISEGKWNSLSKVEPSSDSSGIKHSTPVLASEFVSSIFTKSKRISAIRPEINNLLSNSNNNNSESEQTLEKVKRDVEVVGMNEEEEFLAAFGKEFDSVTSLMEEVSLNILREPEANLAIVINNSKILSDSDAAALQAIVDDSKAFESEDMFADLEEKDQEEIIRTNNNQLQLQKETAVTASTLAGETLGHSSLNESQSDIFEDSTNFERTSGLSSARNISHETILNVTLSPGKNIKVMKVMAPKFIPQNIFNPSKPIGIGIKLAPPKRSVSNGIGANINKKNSGNKNGDQGKVHTISLYNGGDEIWVFEWHQDELSKLLQAKSGKLKNISSKLGELFERITSPVVLFDAKYKLRKFLKSFEEDLFSRLPKEIWDPKIAQWMLEYDENDFNLNVDKLSDLYLDREGEKIREVDWCKEIVNSYLAFSVMKPLREKLIQAKLWDHFTKTEMPSIIPLMMMEMNGFGMDIQQLNRMKRILEFKIALLEMKAIQLAGKQFNLSSPQDIKKILFKVIGLKQPIGTTGTGKNVLSKLDHELPQIIMEWRKITSALQKVIIPFQQAKNLDLETSRVHGHYSHFTVTGRVTMSEPSLQCVPRDFDLLFDFHQEEIETLKRTSKVRFGSKLSLLINSIDKGISTGLAEESGQSLISLRALFIPCSEDFVLVSADYSQLELRILAHLSQDKELMDALNKLDKDVFISIASSLKNIPEKEVTAGMRQEAKGVVYGVIYGMGTKALSQQLEVEEAEAAKFKPEFMRNYPGVSNFLDKAVKSCRENGFIETISGRRRYLPLINSKNLKKRAQAERQAVNSQIQGSASDLVKNAMTKIHAKISQMFPGSCIPITWKSNTACGSVEAGCSSRSNSTLSIGSGKALKEVVCFPVLNLHDELIFEVKKTFVNQVARVIRKEMESSLKISVRLPVVVKTGASWGNLTVFQE